MDVGGTTGDELNVVASKPTLPHSSATMEYTFESNVEIDCLMKELLTLYPKPIRAKVRALSNLQKEIICKEVKFHHLAHEMEISFQKELNECYDTIARIVNGQEDPDRLDDSDGDANDLADQPTGVPEFWLTVLKNSLFGYLVKEADEPPLKALTDIRCVLKTDPEPGFLLEFHFDRNDYFTNKTLTKEYFLRCAPDIRDPASFEGFEIHNCVGCTIDWKPERSLTGKVDAEKPDSDVGGSFFEFFEPEKQIHQRDEPDLYHALEQNDFQLGYYIKEKLIPRAVFLFQGEPVGMSDNCDNCYCERCYWHPEEFVNVCPIGTPQEPVERPKEPDAQLPEVEL